MYISRIKVENIRGFSGPRNVDLTLTRPDGSHAGWTVIAGRNGSGKTSLLRAIALAVSGPSVTRNLLPDFQDWIAAGEDSGSTEVELVRDPGFDRLSGRATSPGLDDDLLRMRYKLTWEVDEAQEASDRRGSEPLLIADPDKRFRGQGGPWRENSRGWLCAAYGPFRRLVGGAPDAQRLMQSRGPVSRLASLFHEDASLTEGVQWLIGQHLQALEGDPAASLLKEAALTILADGLLPDKYQVADVDSSGLWVVSEGRRYPLREMSDGYRTVTALVVDLLKQIEDAARTGLMLESWGGVPVVPFPGVVIIDEADAHLHVSWQKRIGGWLKAHFPRIQFIVTSHSPYICQAADPGGLIRLSGPHEEEPPRVVEQHLYDRIVFGSGDDAVLSDLFGLDSPYSEQAEYLRQELVALETKVAQGLADEQEISDYRALRRRLTSSAVARVDEVAARLLPSTDLGSSRGPGG